MSAKACMVDVAKMRKTMGHETKEALAELAQCDSIAHFRMLCAAAAERRNSL